MGQKELIRSNIIVSEIFLFLQHLQNPHDVCVHTGSQSVYVGELNPGTVWKLSRQSATAETNTPVHVHIIKKPNAPDHTGKKYV